MLANIVDPDYVASQMGLQFAYVFYGFPGKNGLRF